LGLNKVPGTGESRELYTVDGDGNLLHGNLVYHPVKVRVGDHLSLMQKASFGIAFDEEITWTAHRVLRYLEAVLEYENALPITQKGIADALKIHRQQVNLAFKILLQKGLVEKIEISGLRPIFRLNPNYGWRGKHTEWRKELGKAQPLAFVSKELIAA
jgi:hypothetical protein